MDLSGPAGSNRVGEPRSRKGPDRVREDLDREVFDAGAVPASAMDDQVRRIRRGADDDVTVVTPRGGQRQPAGPAPPPAQRGARRDED